MSQEPNEIITEDDGEEMYSSSGDPESVVSLFSEEEIRTYVDPDLTEEEYMEHGLNYDMFFRKRPIPPESEAEILDPAFLFRNDAEPVLTEDRDPDTPEKTEPEHRKKQQDPEKKKRKFQKLKTNNKPEQKSAADSAGEKEKKRRPKKRRRKMTYQKRTKISAIAILVILGLGICLAAAFFLAYRYSNSKTYIIKRDKEAPIAETKDLTIFGYETVTVEDFIVSIKDDTEVAVSFAEPIDYSIDGEQTVRIRMVDEAGNEGIAEAKITIIHDYEAPVIIIGEPMIRTVVGKPVAYKSYIKVQDNMDEAPEITVDNSQVNLSAEGSYPITYTITDRSGNSVVYNSVVEVTPSHGSVSDEEVDAMVDQILSAIITEDMDDLHKVWAIYTFVRSIPYALTDYSYDYKYEGYQILHNNIGDCYGSYSASKLMMDRLGIMNISVENRPDAPNRHFWNMVSLDGGNTWYHFDATHWANMDSALVTCMVSTSVLDQVKSEYIYDKSLYPETPAQSMPIPDDV